MLSFFSFLSFFYSDVVLHFAVVLLVSTIWPLSSRFFSQVLDEFIGLNCTFRCGLMEIRRVANITQYDRVLLYCTYTMRSYFIGCTIVWKTMERTLITIFHNHHYYISSKLLHTHIDEKYMRYDHISWKKK